MQKKISPRELSDQALELLAGRFRALGEPSRLKLLAVLEEGEKNVTELVTATALTQPNASRHLQFLVQAGILARRKSGLNVLYSIADPFIFDLCDQVCRGMQKQLKHGAKAFSGALR